MCFFLSKDSVTSSSCLSIADCWLLIIETYLSVVCLAKYFLRCWWCAYSLRSFFRWYVTLIQCCMILVVAISILSCFLYQRPFSEVNTGPERKSLLCLNCTTWVVSIGLWLPVNGIKDHLVNAVRSSGEAELAFRLCSCYFLLYIYFTLSALSYCQEEATAIKAAGKSWYQTMISDSDYTEFENFSKWLGVSQ